MQKQSRLSMRQVLTSRTHKLAWRNEKHRTQWRSTLENYAFPIIGTLSVAAVDTPAVLKILEPMWRTKPETASRVRGRIKSVLNWATARGFRQGENPARWRGHLDRLLPARSRVKTVKHHPALPFAELPAVHVAIASPRGGRCPRLRAHYSYGAENQRSNWRTLAGARSPTQNMDCSGRAHESKARTSHSVVRLRCRDVIKASKRR